MHKCQQCTCLRGRASPCCCTTDTRSTWKTCKRTAGSSGTARRETWRVVALTWSRRPRAPAPGTCCSWCAGATSTRRPATTSPPTASTSGRKTSITGIGSAYTRFHFTHFIFIFFYLISFTLSSLYFRIFFVYYVIFWTLFWILQIKVPTSVFVNPYFLLFFILFQNYKFWSIWMHSDCLNWIKII